MRRSKTWHNPENQVHSNKINSMYNQKILLILLIEFQYFCFFILVIYFFFPRLDNAFSTLGLTIMFIIVVIVGVFLGLALFYFDSLRRYLSFSKNCFFVIKKKKVSCSYFMFKFLSCLKKIMMWRFMETM